MTHRPCPAATLAALLAVAGAARAAEAPEWLADIRARAEGDLSSAAAGAAQLTLTPDDLVTIKRKLDFGEARLTLSLRNLRSHVVQRLGAARAAAHRASVEACLAEPSLPWGGRTVSLLEVPALLASEPDAGRRRDLQAAAEERQQQLLAVTQYAYLAESRALGAYTADGLPGFRSRDEASLPDLLDGAHHIIYETEPLLRWLSTRVAEDAGVPGALSVADLPRLVAGPGPGALTDEVAPRAVQATAADLGLAQAVTGLSVKPGAAPWGSPEAVPVDPPARVEVRVATLAGRQGLRDLLVGAGIAITYLAAPADDPFESRWLAAPSVRAAYGYLLGHLAGRAAWVREKLPLSGEDVDRHLRAHLLARLLHARGLAAQVLFEDALRVPSVQAVPTYASLHTRGAGVTVTPEAAAFFAEALRRSAPAELVAASLAARIEKSLTAAHGDAWWKTPAATRKLRDAISQAGKEEVTGVRNRFRAQRDDARTLSEALMAEGRALGFR